MSTQNPVTHPPRVFSLLRRVSPCLVAIWWPLVLAACTPLLPTDLPAATLSPSPVLPPLDTTVLPVEPSVAPSVPITLTVNLGRPPLSLDPLRVAPLDAAARDLTENLFAGLARLDPDTGLVEPLLARSWEPSPDGLTWIVYLRDDLSWVAVNPTTAAVEPMRPLVAADVIAAVRYACRSDTQAPLASAAFIIQGCELTYQQDPATLTTAFFEQNLGARVLNDVAVEFRLASNPALFPTLLSMPILRPIPADRLDALGADWASPNSLWTSGPYAFQLGPETGYTLLANPFWPLDRRGNIDRIVVRFDADPQHALSDWSAGLLDLTVLPAHQITSPAFDRDPAYRLLAQPAAAFIAFSYDTYPFGNPGVRRAFALSIDRRALVDQILAPNGVPALPAPTLIPPGMAARPPSDQSGVAYDPDTARRLLGEAGFGQCFNMPAITLLTDQSDLSLALAQTYAAMWSATLGCSPDLFTIQQLPLHDLLTAARQPPTGIETPRPALIALTWQADSFDAHHWLADILGCRQLFPTAYLDQARPCLDADQRLLEAASLPDDTTRAALYAAIAADLFNPLGEMPIIPLFFYARPLAIRPGLTIYPTQAGPLQFDRWLASTD